MTAEEKTSLACFLDLAAAAKGSGYLLHELEYSFEDDEKIGSGEWGVGSGDRTQSNNITSGTSPDSSNKNISPPKSPLVPGAEDSLEKVAEDIKACTLCRLCETRTNAVPGEGVSRPLVMVIGEGPGKDEDTSGRPFVGIAGQLLDKMLSSIGLSRGENCFIANVVKCRPPQNRDPLPDETAACASFLARQIQLLQPRFILCAGRIAAHTLLDTSESIGKLRGKFINYQTGGREIPFIVTYHPSAILRNEDFKRPTWEDLKLLRSTIETSNTQILTKDSILITTRGDAETQRKEK
jgi:DNA polymerase